MNSLSGTLPLYASLITSNAPTTPTLASLPLLLSPYISHLSAHHLFVRLSATIVEPRLFRRILSIIQPLARLLDADASQQSGIGSKSSAQSRSLASKLLFSNGLEHIVLDGSDLYGPLLSYLSLAIAIILQHQSDTVTSATSLAIYGTVFSSLMIWCVIAWSLYYFGCIVWLQRRRMQWHEVLCLVGYQLFAVFIINGLLGGLCAAVLASIIGTWMAELSWFTIAALLSASATWSVGSVLFAESDEMVLLPHSNGQFTADHAKRHQGGLIALGMVAIMQVALVLWLRYAITFVV